MLLISYFPEFSEYSVYPGRLDHFFKLPLTKVDKLPDYPLSIYIGTLGMPGMTAYQGMKAFATERIKTVRFSQISEEDCAHL